MMADLMGTFANLLPAFHLKPQEVLEGEQSHPSSSSLPCMRRPPHYTLALGIHELWRVSVCRIVKALLMQAREQNSQSISASGMEGAFTGYGEQRVLFADGKDTLVSQVVEETRHRLEREKVERDERGKSCCIHPFYDCTSMAHLF